MSRRRARSARPGAAALLIAVALLCATSGRVAAQAPTTTTVPADDPAATPTTTASTVAPSTSSTTAPTTTALAAPPRSSPGVYADQLGSAETIQAAATGVPVIIGSATPTATSTVPGTPVASPSEFDTAFDDPSPSMEAAVSSFFAAGGEQALVVAVSSDDPSTLAQALTTAADEVDGWDLLVVPALAELGGADWTSLATAMASTASEQQAVALLDPPTDAVAAATTDAGAQLVAAAAQLRATPWSRAAVLYSSPLRAPDGSTAATAPAGAGVLAAGDRAAGPWATPGGTAHPIPGLTPALVVDNPLSATLAPAGFTVVRTVPGYGTVLMGNQNVSLSVDERELSVVRTLDMIERSVESGLQPYVFAPNDETTWAQVVAAVEALLEELREQDALIGATPSEAYTVATGVGTTMTDQDVLDGEMVVEVKVQLGDPARTIELTFTQTMAS